MRIIKVTPEFLMERLQGNGNISAATSNLPSNTELLDIKYDLFTKQVIAVVRSESFEDIAETYPIPEFDLIYSTRSKAATQTSLNATAPKILTTDSKLSSVATTEPVPEKKTVIPSRQDTSMTEEEFTEEQRKLVSFSVDGEFVIVKPVKFLKGEWDDINDTVRSLGGRWVKGDIISYWEIPLPQS